MLILTEYDTQWNKIHVVVVLKKYSKVKMARGRWERRAKSRNLTVENRTEDEEMQLVSATAI